MVITPIAAAEAAGIPVGDIADIYGVVAEPGESLEEALLDDAFLPLIMAIDRTETGRAAFSTLGVREQGSLGANIIDKVCRIDA